MHALVASLLLVQLPMPPQAPAPPQAPPVVCMKPVVSEATESRVIPACVYVGAEWCNPCRQTKPFAEQLKRDGFNIHFKDADRDARWLRTYRVSSLPTILLFDEHGKELRRHTGAMGSRQQLLNFLGRESLPDELYNAAKPVGFASKPVELPAKPVGFSVKPGEFHGENDLHSHRCDGCGTVWWHRGSEAAQNPRSHNCPRCGREQYVVHSWANTGRAAGRPVTP